MSESDNLVQRVDAKVDRRTGFIEVTLDFANETDSFLLGRRLAVILIRKLAGNLEYLMNRETMDLRTRDEQVMEDTQ